MLQQVKGWGGHKRFWERHLGREGRGRGQRSARVALRGVDGRAGAARGGEGERPPALGRWKRKQFDDALRMVGHLENQLYYERHPDLQRMHALCHVQVRQPVEARRILTALTESEAGTRDFEAWRLTADVAVLLED